MQSRISSLLATLLAVIIGSSTAYAGCTDTQFAGTWDVVFSDGNSCRLVLAKGGEVLIDDLNLSTCLDPFRGTTTPDEGGYSVLPDCSVAFELLVEGATLQMYGRLVENRKSGAGFYVIFVPDVFADKGSFNLIRVD